MSFKKKCERQEETIDTNDLRLSKMQEHIYDQDKKIAGLESYKKNNELLNANFRNQIAMAHKEKDEMKELIRTAIMNKEMAE